MLRRGLSCTLATIVEYEGTVLPQTLTRTNQISIVYLIFCRPLGNMVSRVALLLAFSALAMAATTPVQVQAYASSL